MARDQARRLAKVEAALEVGSSLPEQIGELPDMHLARLVVLEAMNEVYDFMPHAVLVRGFLVAVRRGRAFTPPGWTAAMDEECAARLRQLHSGALEWTSATDYCTHVVCCVHSERTSPS
jgi:hypothetical protein